MQPLLQWKTMSIKQPVCEFVASGIQHAICMRHMVMWPAPPKTFFHIIS